MSFKQKIYNLLRWSQKYTKIDMLYLAKGWFWTVLSQTILTIATFFLSLVFANFLDPNTYGNYKYIISLTGLLAIFALPGLGTALSQATARGFEGTFYSGFKERLKFASIGSTLALILALYYSFKGNFNLALPLLISAFFLPLWQASGLYKALLGGRKLFKFQTEYFSLTTVIYALSMAITLLITKNLFWLVAIYFLSNTFSNFFFYLKTKKKFKPNKKEDKETIRYGKHLSLISIIGTIASQLDRILIFHYLGAAQVAIYSFAIALPEQIRGLLKNTQTLILPKFAPKPVEEIKKGLPRKLVIFFLISLFTVFFYIILAPPIYKIFFPKYPQSIKYSQVFALSILATPSTLIGTLFKAKAAKRKIYYVTLFSSFTRIILMFLLVLKFGLWGIVWGMVAARILTFLFSLWLAKKI